MKFVNGSSSADAGVNINRRNIRDTYVHTTSTDNTLPVEVYLGFIFEKGNLEDPEKKYMDKSGCTACFPIERNHIIKSLLQLESPNLCKPSIQKIRIYILPNDWP